MNAMEDGFKKPRLKINKVQEKAPEERGRSDKLSIHRQGQEDQTNETSPSKPPNSIKLTDLVEKKKEVQVESSNVANQETNRQESKEEEMARVLLDSIMSGDAKYIAYGNGKIVEEHGFQTGQYLYSYDPKNKKMYRNQEKYVHPQYYNNIDEHYDFKQRIEIKTVNNTTFIYAWFRVFVLDKENDDMAMGRPGNAFTQGLEIDTEKLKSLIGKELDKDNLSDRRVISSLLHNAGSKFIPDYYKHLISNLIEVKKRKEENNNQG